MIDFTEISSGIKGEKLQALVRFLARDLNIEPSWSGRGPDQGKDLILTETLRGPITTRPMRWLVQCKDKAQSGKSVSESECGSILDKVKQHHCGGYLLVTTTTAGSALKAALDALDAGNGGPIYTRVWDMYHLDLLLRRPEHEEIFKSYFPKSWLREGTVPMEDVIRTLKAVLTTDQFESIEGHLELDSNPNRLPRGYEISPSNNRNAKIVEEVTDWLTQGKTETAADGVEALEADVLTKLVREIATRKPDIASEFLRVIIRRNKRADLVLNALQMLVDLEEIAPDESMELSSYLDESGLEVLFGDEVASFVHDEVYSNGEKYAFWTDIDELSSNTTVEDLWIDSLSLSNASRQRISFEGALSLYVQLEFDGEALGDKPLRLPGAFRGYFDSSGMHLDDVTVDTSDY